MNNNDEKLIKKFITWAIDNNLNQARIAEVVNRTPAWASLLINKKIKSLNFDTRNLIKKILGIQ